MSLPGRRKEFNKQCLAHNQYQMLMIIITIKKKVPFLPDRCNLAGCRAWQVEEARFRPLPPLGATQQYTALQPPMPCLLSKALALARVAAAASCRLPLHQPGRESEAPGPLFKNTDSQGPASSATVVRGRGCGEGLGICMFNKPQGIG